MNDLKVQFRKRLRGIDHRHNRFSRDGYQARLRSDGLIELVPQRSKRSWTLARVAVFFFAAFFAFKGFLIAYLGNGSYELRVQDLADGVWTERVGATVMRIDPLSQWVADKVKPYIR